LGAYELRGGNTGGNHCGCDYDASHGSSSIHALHYYHYHGTATTSKISEYSEGEKGTFRFSSFYNHLRVKPGKAECPLSPYVTVIMDT
jgi:hypothetical protein